MMELGAVSYPDLRCALLPPPREFKNGLFTNRQSSNICLWSCGLWSWAYNCPQEKQNVAGFVERSSWKRCSRFLFSIVLAGHPHLQWWCYCFSLSLRGPGREGPEQLLCGTWKILTQTSDGSWLYQVAWTQSWMKCSIQVHFLMRCVLTVCAKLNWFKSAECLPLCLVCFPVETHSPELLQYVSFISANKGDVKARFEEEMKAKTQLK